MCLTICGVTGVQELIIYSTHLHYLKRPTVALLIERIYQVCTGLGGLLANEVVPISVLEVVLV